VGFNQTTRRGNPRRQVVGYAGYESFGEVIEARAEGRYQALSTERSAAHLAYCNVRPIRPSGRKRPWDPLAKLIQECGE
jgi:hypothetical protein